MVTSNLLDNIPWKEHPCATSTHPGQPVDHLTEIDQVSPRLRLSEVKPSTVSVFGKPGHVLDTRHIPLHDFLNDLKQTVTRPLSELVKRHVVVALIEELTFPDVTKRNTVELSSRRPYVLQTFDEDVPKRRYRHRVSPAFLDCPCLKIICGANPLQEMIG